jgi:hypothetical protein
MNARIRLYSDFSEAIPSRALFYRVPGGRTNATPVVLFALLVLAGFGYWCWDSGTLEARASRNNANAQYRFGKRSLDNAKSPAECQAAAEWIRMAADQRHAKAQIALGMLYAKGVGVCADDEEAVKWLRRAADQGAAVAQNELGVLYAKGRGIPQNLDEATLWCGKAAAQGFKVAERNLALIEAAKHSFIGDLTTADGQVLKNVTLQSVDADGITVTLQAPQGGVAVTKLKAENLTGHFRDLCGCAAQSAAHPSEFSQLFSITVRL